MNPYVIIPFFLGTLAVFQPLLNRVILEDKGIALAAWLNSLILFTVASLIVVVIYYGGDRFPEHLRPKLGGWRWWYLLPGMMGFALVFGLPLSMRALGAFPSIIALLLGQLLVSFVYDALANGRPITLSRVAGLLFAALGAYLTFRPAD